MKDKYLDAQLLIADQKRQPILGPLKVHMKSSILLKEFS